MSESKQPVLAFFGHHKAASTWIQKICCDICELTGKRMEIVWSPGQFDHDLGRFLTERKVDFLCYTNADFQYVEPVLDRLRGFHVIRDPRDMVVSAYFSHRKSHDTSLWPELEEMRARISELPEKEGLLQTIADMDTLIYDGTPARVISAMSDWNYDSDSILELRYEEITTSPLAVWREILKHLRVVKNVRRIETKGLAGEFLMESFRQSVVRLGGSRGTIPWWFASLLLDRHDFGRKTRDRKRGEGNSASHYRKGKAGDWENYFDGELARAFEKRFGDVVGRLGYE